MSCLGGSRKIHKQCPWGAEAQLQVWWREYAPQILPSEPFCLSTQSGLQSTSPWRAVLELLPDQEKKTGLHHPCVFHEALCCHRVTHSARVLGLITCFAISPVGEKSKSRHEGNFQLAEYCCLFLRIPETYPKSSLHACTHTNIYIHVDICHSLIHSFTHLSIHLPKYIEPLYVECWGLALEELSTYWRRRIFALAVGALSSGAAQKWTHFLSDSG